MDASDETRAEASTVAKQSLPDSDDGWSVSPDGARYWGRHGAAGLLIHAPDKGILLQHRAAWNHFGGTWGLPGGALQQGESPTDGAFREAAEEAGVPRDALTILFTSVLELGFWSYTTVVAEVTRPFEPRIGDHESIELRWVPIAHVQRLPLHPGFADSWGGLRQELVRDATDASGAVWRGAH